MLTSPLPCIYCGHPSEQTDHIVSRDAGGTDDHFNLAPACKSCNSAKGKRPVEHFLRQHPEILARVRAHQNGLDVLSGLSPGRKPRALDDRISTTLRISPEGLEALKNIAAAKRIRVNDLLLEGVERVLARYAPSST
jgi:hypothetical protein